MKPVLLNGLAVVFKRKQLYWNKLVKSSLKTKSSYLGVSTPLPLEFLSVLIL